MRIAYVAPSELPSRAANAVHVAHQCNGLTRAGASVTLYVKRSVEDPAQFAPALTEAYGVRADSMRLVSFFSSQARADTLRIAGMAVRDLTRNPVDAILSRNLYAAYALAVLKRRPMLFETHQLEFGIRRLMQKAIMTRPWVTTVVISEALGRILGEHHRTAPRRLLIAHDAAPEGIVATPANERRQALQALFPQAAGDWQMACGYFGHLYPGRGVEIVEAVAAARPKCLFLMFGGNERDIEQRRLANRSPNLLYIGHVPHPLAQRAMGLFDALLMPYQSSVSIGVARHDTARWMSPMKMFEYLASGVPVIASNLPVLGEVLTDGENCLLVDPADAAAWVAALDRLVGNPALRATLGSTARSEYLTTGSWTHRANLLLQAARAL